MTSVRSEWWVNRSVGVSEAQLGAEARPFLADDQPHALQPAGQAVSVELGDPGAVADLAAGFDSEHPGGGRDCLHGLVNLLGDGPASRVGRPSALLRGPFDGACVPPPESVQISVCRPRQYLVEAVEPP